jgi:glycerophosphoryl diester phosphodiesterase
MRPLRLGHRGARASKQVPENTLASFELCLAHGCDGFEFDVQRSADGVAVICHDPAVRGLRIESTAANELALPTLDQVMRQFSTRAFLDVELKVSGVERGLIAALRQHPPTQGYVVSSFLSEVLAELHTLDPDIPLGFLYDRQSQLPPLALPFAWMIPHFKLVDHNFIEEVHASGRKIMIWTVNQAADMSRLAGWGADAIISDETELLVRSLI